MRNILDSLQGIAVPQKSSKQVKPENMNRHGKRRQRTREAILIAAADTFLRKGVANTTVADITEAADVGYGTFYNHFHSLHDVISAVAEKTISRVVTITDTILPEENVLELVPAISVRIIMRLLSKDPTIRWLLEQPYIFVDEWRKIVTPSMMEFVERGRGTKLFEAIGGAQTWIRIFPWILISELNDAIEKGSSVAHEEHLANMSIRLMGLDDARREAIVETSRKIVNAAKLPPF